jgi:hypothetical protein
MFLRKVYLTLSMWSKYIETKRQTRFWNTSAFAMVWFWYFAITKSWLCNKYLEIRIAWSKVVTSLHYIQQIYMMVIFPIKYSIFPDIYESNMISTTLCARNVKLLTVSELHRGFGGQVVSALAFHLWGHPRSQGLRRTHAVERPWERGCCLPASVLSCLPQS